MLNNQNIEKCKTCPSVKDDRYYQGFTFENKQTNKNKSKQKNNNNNSNINNNNSNNFYDIFI